MMNMMPIMMMMMMMINYNDDNDNYAHDDGPGPSASSRCCHSVRPRSSLAFVLPPQFPGHPLRALPLLSHVPSSETLASLQSSYYAARRGVLEFELLTEQPILQP